MKNRRWRGGRCDASHLSWSSLRVLLQLHRGTVILVVLTLSAGLDIGAVGYDHGGTVKLTSKEARTDGRHDAFKNHSAISRSAEWPHSTLQQADRQLRTLTEAPTSETAVRVLVVNDIPGHFEVLAGVLSALHRLQRNEHGFQLAPKPRVLYTGNPQGPIDNGLQDWLGGALTNSFSWHPFSLTSPGANSSIVAKPHRSLLQESLQQGPHQQGSLPAEEWRTPADIVLCVSAELAPKVCRAIVKAVQPRLLVVMVHRADTHSRNARILSLYPFFKLLALAPHVANLSSHMLRRPVDWALPVAPFRPAVPCTSKKCLRGFSIQGALRRFKSRHGDGFTRDYSGLWQRMMALRAAGQSLPRVVVVGKGERGDLHLPPQLEDRVAFHPWLRYPDFWSLIHHSFALVPTFGMPVYYESRISSTILASLLTCVPIVAEQRLLRVYNFLSERHVFLRLPGEDEAAAMVRIMGLPEEEIFARRAALCELRTGMDARMDGMLTTYLRQAMMAELGAGGS